MIRQDVLVEPNQRKWSQGCLLKATSMKLPWLELNKNEDISSDKHPANASTPLLNWRVEYKTLDDDDFLVIVSQTCDIRRIASKEPYIEAIRAFWTDDKGLINEAQTNSNRHFPYGGTVCQDSFWAKIRQNSTVRETCAYLFRYTCAGV